MKTYESMKSSSVFWLGMIPEHWECMKIGSLFSQRKNKVSDKDYAPLSVTKMGILPQLESAAKTNDGDNRKLVCAGDFVINSRSDRKGSCGVSELDGSVSLINLVLTPRNEWNNRYAHYLLRSQPFSEEYYRYGRGIVADLWTTRFSEMKNIMLPVPPREEQDHIVRFLNWKVSEINRLINIKRKEIERIEELKKAVVSHAVTQGLDSTVTMKSSGVNWLGDIPAHWELSKVKHQFYIENGSDPVIDGDIPVYGSGADSFKTCGEYKCGPTVLLGRKGATLHIPHYITGCYWNVDTAFNTVAKPYCKVSMLFFYFLATLFDYNFYKTQTTLPSMTQFNYKNIIIPVPPLTEQENILKYLEQELSKYDGIISNKNKEIKCLNEFKIRLISDVVTGKIDVRGIEIPEYQYTEEVNDIVDVDDQEESNEQED